MRIASQDDRRKAEAHGPQNMRCTVQVTPDMAVSTVGDDERRDAEGVSGPEETLDHDVRIAAGQRRALSSSGVHRRVPEVGRPRKRSSHVMTQTVELSRH